MYHYIYLTYSVPAVLDRVEAVETIENLIYPHVSEFKCLPRDDYVNSCILDKYGHCASDECVDVNVMIKLTDEEALNSVGDRSEFQHAAPTSIEKKERKSLRNMSKRKRAESTDEDVKKIKRSDCHICLFDVGTRKSITLKCNHTFHDNCIVKWLSIKKICPVCYVDVHF